MYLGVYFNRHVLSPSYVMELDSTVETKAARSLSSSRDFSGEEMEHSSKHGLGDLANSDLANY